MTQDEIIEMAKQAGIIQPQNVIKTLEAFANLVAQHEREACAFDAEWCIENHLEHHIPERIRSRGNK